MKKTLFLLASAIIIAACSTKTSDPIQEAIVSKIAQTVGDGAKVTVFTMERIDSTSMAGEFDYRQNLFNAKLRENTKFFDSYMRQGKKKNAQKHKIAMMKDEAAINNLASLRDSLAALPDKPLEHTAYYIYKFSGYAMLDGAKTEFTDYFAAVSPEGEVLSLGPSRKGLSAGLGRIIPGYYKAIGSEGE